VSVSAVHPAFVSFASSLMAFTIAPTAAHHGNYTLAITASDVYGGSTTVSLVLQVNRPPTQSLATPSVITSRVGLSFSYALPADLFVDADGDALSYSIVTTSVEYPKPVWLSLSGVTLSGTPTSNTHAPASLLMSASDGRGGSAAFVLRVDVPNTPPRLVSGVANQTFDTSGTRSLAVPSGSCVDADGDAISYALASVSGGGQLVVVRVHVGRVFVLSAVGQSRRVQCERVVLGRARERGGAAIVLVRRECDEPQPDAWCASTAAASSDCRRCSCARAAGGYVPGR
jgi:hypothetical protein